MIFQSSLILLQNGFDHCFSWQRAGIDRKVGALQIQRFESASKSCKRSRGLSVRNNGLWVSCRVLNKILSMEQCRYHKAAGFQGFAVFRLQHRTAAGNITIPLIDVNCWITTCSRKRPLRLRRRKWSEYPRPCSPDDFIAIIKRALHLWPIACRWWFYPRPSGRSSRYSQFFIDSGSRHARQTHAHFLS